MNKILNLFLLTAFILMIGNSAHATIYYSQKSNGKGSAVNVLSNWNSLTNGLGVTPSNFTSGDEFHIINNDAMTATAAWTISGGGKLVIDNGSFTASGFDHTLTLDMKNTSKYIVTSAYANLTLGSLDPTSTFEVRYTSASVISFLRYLNYGSGLTLNNLTNATTTINLSSTFSVGGDFIITSNAILNRTFAINASITLSIAGNFIQNNATFIGGAVTDIAPIISISKDLIINNGAFIGANLGNAQPSFQISGSFVMNNGQFKGVGGTSSVNTTYTIGQDFNITGGKYQAKASSGASYPVFVMTGTGRSINFSPSVTVVDLNHIFNITGSVSLASDFTLNNSLNLTNGSLSIGSNTLTLNKGLTYTGTGSLSGTSASVLTLYSSTALTYNLKAVTVGTLNFNLLNGSTVTLLEDVTVATLLNLQSGSIKKSTGNIVMAANSTINRNLGSLVSAPVFSGATNIIYSTAANITGGAELQGTGGSIKNLTLSMSGSSVLGLFSNLSITGVLTINPGSVFNPGGKTITLSDNFVNNGIFNSNISTIVIAGNTTISGTPESGGFNFYNLTINNGATLTAPASASLLINNTFSPISGSTFNANNGTVNFQDQSGNQAIPGKIQYYNLTLSNSSQKILSVTDTIKIGNILSISGGGVTVANSTINFNGGVQTINNLAYNNLILSGSGLKTPETSSLTANNIIISGSAILNGANATINATGNWTSYGAGAYVNTSGTVIFNNAASPITIDGNGVTFNDITFASAGNKTIISAVSVNGILTLTSGTLYTGDLLSVNLTTGAISGAGSGTLSGNVTYTKDVVTAASNFLAFPVSGATGNDLADDFEFVNPSTNKSRLSIWNCATQKYLTGQAVTTTFTQGVGFQFFASVPGTLDVTGAYDHANTGYTITSCTSAANKFVLAGNPYPSTLDWNSSGWTKTNLNDALYFFNPATSTFATYINGTPSNGGSQYIPSFQGFYITTNGAGIGSLTSTNAVRTTLTNPGLYRTANTSTIALEVSYKHYTDEAVIVLNEDASFDFEGDKDAIKLMNPDAAPSLYTKSMGVDYSINSIPSIGTGYVLPLGLSVSETGSYTFTPKNLSDISGSVFLEDKLTGDMIDLKSTPSHTVTIDSTQTNRFQLRFASSGSTTTASASSTKIYYYDGLIHVAFQDASANGNMALYNVLGNTVMDNITINGSGEVATKNIQPGTYIVRVIENGQISTQKIIIQ